MNTESFRQKLTRLYVSQIGYDPFLEPLEDGSAPTEANIANTLHEYAEALLTDMPHLRDNSEIKECLALPASCDP